MLVGRARRRRTIARHLLVGAARGAIGLGGGIAQAFDLGHDAAEITQSLVAHRGRRILRRILLRRRRRLRMLALDRVRLDLADRLFERQALAGNLGFVKRRIDGADEKPGVVAMGEQAPVVPEENHGAGRDVAGRDARDGNRLAAEHMAEGRVCHSNPRML